MGRTKVTVENREEELERQLMAEGDESLYQLDPSTMDPNMHYRFVRETQGSIMKREMKGYRLVNADTDGVRLRMQPPDSQTADARIRVAGQVLMCCPMDVYRNRTRDNLAFSEERLRGPEERFKKEAEAGGYSTITTQGPA